MSTNTVQGSINALQAALGFWIPSVGTNNEPAITAANMTQQVMMSPPFKWNWNRTEATFAVTGATTDYTETYTNFGFLEKAIFQPSAGGQYLPLAVFNCEPISKSSDAQQPISLTALLNIIGTSVTFRIFPLPDQAYNVTVTYQNFPVLISTLSATWTPPDYMSYIYNRGFLAHLYEARGDIRAQQEKIAFAAALLSTAEGLTDTEKNIFLAQYLMNPRMLESTQLKVQQGIVARGS